ncbi:carbamoyl transferase [Malaciobacter mytili]|uniref:carbamoyltransferase family protein n=1 Tax=Malaciobacter mytili TaxID=603050 RepID=UPI00100A3B79|nr:carbamoyltransferase C-terminal domain-containing protein [Malaciobacter mytili]RXI36660.1 carbamoyl transferase [Malaciobacter mytili]
MSQYYIGLSTSGHDPSFTIVDSKGKVLVAEATERYLQDKRAWGSLPDHMNHLKSFLEKIIDTDENAEFQIAKSWKKIKADLPVEISDDLIEKSIGEWIRNLQAIVQKNAGVHCQMIAKNRILPDFLNFDHHHCHATAAVYSAPFDNAVCLVLDGEGEVGSASVFMWDGITLKRIWRSWGPGSLGTFYSTLTELCGFSTIAGEEWKVMGLAAYGKVDDKIVELLRKLITIEDGKPMLAVENNLKEVMAELKKYKHKESEDILNSANLAASGQFVYSELANQILKSISNLSENLILTGGCALNSSFNGTILKNHPFKSVHIPSAPADDGNSLGAAILAWKHNQTNLSLPFNQVSPFLGSEVNSKDLNNLTNHSGLEITQIDINDTNFIAKKLSQGIIIGVMRGKAEFGPRALGNRSILADPRPKNMKERINKIVKGRENYRPFAPIIPFELMNNWFEQVQPCPYMSFTLKWKNNAKELVPAVVHEDNTGRVQTLDKHNFSWLYNLCMEFNNITGIPILLNTSFNVMGKPIVHTVNDAISVLHTTGLNAILIENIYIEKK